MTNITNAFPRILEKKSRIKEYLSQYDFLHALTAVFAIASWRYNRGAQESCLALNSALAEIDKWGNKRIITDDEFLQFYKDLYPLLRITHMDDPVLPDFGELKLNYKSRYYSVITGTGHTVSVFSALQFLERLSEYTHMDEYTLKLLEYSDYYLSFLKNKNASIDANYKMCPCFEYPTFDYFVRVQEFLAERKWDELGLVLLSMFDVGKTDIIHSHFFLHEGTYYPLFNPSLVIDYQTKILQLTSEHNLHRIILSTLVDKLSKIYDTQSFETGHTMEKIRLLNGSQPILYKKDGFAYLNHDHLVIFLDCTDGGISREELETIKKIHENGCLSVVDLEDRLSTGACKAYRVHKLCKVNVICFDDYINLEEQRIKLGSRDEKHIYTAIDIMYMLMISSDVSQIAEFDENGQNAALQVTSWGGVTDYFTLYISENGYISKGAVSYNVVTEIDTSAAYNLSKYIELERIFPFCLSSDLFAPPECWNCVEENSVHQFERKSDNLSGGTLFRFHNDCFVFVEFDYLSILEKSNVTQARLNLETFKAIVEKFFVLFSEDLGDITNLEHSLILFNCSSLSNENQEKYVHILNRKQLSNKTVIDFQVNSYKIMNDIAAATDRSIEYRIIRELLHPLILQSEFSFSNLLEKMDVMSYEKKTVGVAAVQLEYYYNPDSFGISVSAVSNIMARKQIAIICEKAGIHPGVYENKNATNVVRSIQENIASCLESKIHPLDRNLLHAQLLSALASEQLSIKLNRTSAVLTKELEQSESIKSLEKSTSLYEQSKMKKEALLYLIETNLFNESDRGCGTFNDDLLSELLSLAIWIIYLQISSDLCVNLLSKTKLIVEDDYRIDIEPDDQYKQASVNDSQRRLIDEPYDLRNSEIDGQYFERIDTAFYEDTGMHFLVLESVLRHLYTASFLHDSFDYEEIAPNVIKIRKSDLITDYSSFAVNNVPEDEVTKAYDFLTVVPEKLKTICDKTHPILPIWERKNRSYRFSVKPLYLDGDICVYSPILMKELRNRWIDGVQQFFPPFELGLRCTSSVLKNWKKYYEKKFSSDVELFLKRIGCEYTKRDADLRREDRDGNHPLINDLGDYDVIALDMKQKKVYLIECKVLHPIGSVFEHNMQQIHFFFEEKYDEKFQKRIDYFREIANSFFSRKGFNIEGFTIQPYMLVNKVFSSYYKQIDFPILTFKELKDKLTGYLP